MLARFTPLSPRHLRLPFRLVRTGIRSPASNRRTAAIRHHPPTHKRTDERTEFSPWHSLIFRRGQNVGGTFLTVHRLRPHHNTPLQGREDLSPSANGKGKIILPTRNVEIAVFTDTPSVSRLRPSHRQARASLFTAALCSAVNKDRCGLRVDRLRPPSALRLRRHPSCVGGWLAPFRLRLQTLFGGYVSLRCQPETSACYSGSSMPCRRSPSCGRREPSISTFLPPAEDDALAIQSVGSLCLTRLARFR